MQLIEELQYRLKSRVQAIEILRKYHENYKIIPAINEVESILVDITADQIATHFDSYFGYLEAALTGQYDQSFFRNLCLDYALDFYQKNNICPTFRAISLANQYNGLLFCTEPEVKLLLGSESELEQCLAERNNPDAANNHVAIESIEIYSPVNKNVTDLYEESLLIDKYSDVIKTRQDLLALSAEDRAEIKKVFISEFRFFSCLQSKKN